MRTRILAGLSAAMLAAGLGAAPSSASTGGEPTGAYQYQAVGLILAYAQFGDEVGRFRCSATLISPTVVLTAAHCTDGTLGQTLVTFDAVIAEDEPQKGDEPLFPAAANEAEGYTTAELQGAGYESGTAITHPEYSNFTDLDTWNDTGVIVLDRPVEGITPMPLADLGTLDEIPPNELRKTIFTAVGYGTEVRKADEGPQNPTPMDFPLVRRFVEMPGQKLDAQVLQTNGNENDPFGTGGTCFGDSGGPLLLNGEIVGVTSYGYTSNCRYIDGYQRVDIGIAQEWLSQFVHLG